MNALTLIIWCISGVGLLLFIELIRQINKVGNCKNSNVIARKRPESAICSTTACLRTTASSPVNPAHLWRAWTYTGHDLNYSTNEEREYFSDIINRALRGMGDGWMIHVDAVRHPAPRYPKPELSHFPDPFRRLWMRNAVAFLRNAASCTRGISY